jgi:hypothetical protein
MQQQPAVQELSREAEFFHKRIFGRPLPDEIRADYISANGMLLKDLTNLSHVRIALILQRSMDVEAIEFALRRRIPQNILTKKLLILCYLAESRNDYFATFVNERHQPFRAFFALSLYTFRSLYKLLKGRCLIWMYDVV